VHQFLDFKSFEDATLDTWKPFTVLIGKNGSGKSNAIEGVELLAELAHGRPLYEISDIGRGAGSFQIRGGLPACPRTGKNAFGLRFSSGLEHDRYQVWLMEYELFVQPLPEPRIQKERLTIGGRVIFDAQLKSGSGILSVKYDNFARGPNKPTETLSAERSVLSRYETFASQNPKRKHVLESVDELRRYLRASFVFDPQPKAMRAYERIGNRVLTRDGANLSAVLYALEKGTETERASLARLLAWIRQLPEEPIAEFAFVTTSLNDVIFGFKESKDSAIVDARLLSDGTLRCLAVLAALETVTEGSRVVIEEFDNGLHPSRVNILTQAISDVTTRRKLNVVCTTHNPATLDGLTPEQLKGVVLCFWDREKKASRLIPLLELPRVDTLLERGHLGDLVTRRILEQHLLPNFEEQQKAKAQEWLGSLP